MLAHAAASSNSSIVQCLNDVDCPLKAEPRCDANAQCVECLESADCTTANKPKCLTDESKCYATCKTSGGSCPGELQRRVGADGNVVREDGSDFESQCCGVCTDDGDCPDDKHCLTKSIYVLGVLRGQAGACSTISQWNIDHCSNGECECLTDSYCWPRTYVCHQGKCYHPQVVDHSRFFGNSTSVVV